MNPSDEWIRTSVIAGYLSAMIDSFTGDDRCQCLARERGVDIDQAFVDQLLAEARAQGIPEVVLRLPPSFTRDLNDPAYLEKLRQYHNAAQRQVEHQRKTKLWQN